MRIETPRLVITDFTPDLARDVHLGSMDGDMRRFLPDEVFETVEEAAEVIAFLMSSYGSAKGPFVHPCLLDGRYIGYVQLAPTEDGFEAGYHIISSCTGMGYATEALSAFLPPMMARLGLHQVFGVCDADNAASIRVLEKCGFRRIFEGTASYQGQMKPVVKMVFGH